MNTVEITKGFADSGNCLDSYPGGAWPGQTKTPPAGYAVTRSLRGRPGPCRENAPYHFADTGKMVRRRKRSGAFPALQDR